MFNIQKVKKFNASEWVTPEALNVSPNLLGMPLARPSRRALAIGLDALAIALLSSVSGIWLVVGVAVVLFQLKKMQTQSSHRKIWLWLTLALLLAISVLYVTRFTENHSTPEKTADAQIVEEDSLPETSASTSAANPVAPVAASNTESAADDKKDYAERINKLEHELKIARAPKIFKWRDELDNWIKSLGLSFGWAIAYFTLMPFWLKGQTLGKKVFGLRVVELTGKPLGLMTCFGRYGGYAAGMATGMIGFVQILWDVNRQAIQDKIAHTVVIDLRLPRRLDLLEENEVKMLVEDET